jgi:hypothetical protein
METLTVSFHESLDERRPRFSLMGIVEGAFLASPGEHPVELFPRHGRHQSGTNGSKIYQSGIASFIVLYFTVYGSNGGLTICDIRLGQVL